MKKALESVPGLAVKGAVQQATQWAFRGRQAAVCVVAVCGYIFHTRCLGQGGTLRTYLT